MDTATYNIAGGDYENGGLASKQLKELLKKIGVAPQAVRRTMIAAYEAEMNVVIHAHKGIMKVAVDSTQVDVAVIDEGPGIPDVKRAMTEGFSTAPPVAREHGFGAGMGLPNIHKNSNHLSVQSTPGRGTQVRFVVAFAPQEISTEAGNSVAVFGEKCRQCLQCLRVCPTQAIRVRNGSPRIAGHLCIDCTSCVSVCEPGALAMDCPAESPPRADETVLALPESFLAQFGAGVAPIAPLEALSDMGFRHVRLSGEWDSALADAVKRYAQEEAVVHPVLSPVCPAVINLILVRFPSLIGHIAPFLTAIEAAREELTVPHVIFAPVCPAQRTLLRSLRMLTRTDLMMAARLRVEVASRLAHQTRGNASGQASVAASRDQENVLHISGISHVVKALDEIENGLMDDYQTIELYACDQGCFGSPVWTEDPFISRRRLERADYKKRKGQSPPRSASATRRLVELRPRMGLRLDADMGKAIEKLAAIDALTKRMPGRNCGVCGAPTCAVHAEDVVLGRVTVDACPFRDEETAGGP